MVPMKYLPESLSDCAKSRDPGRGCESENMKSRNASRLNGRVRYNTVRSRYSSSVILPRSNDETTISWRSWNSSSSRRKCSSAAIRWVRSQALVSRTPPISQKMARMAVKRRFLPRAKVLGKSLDELCQEGAVAVSFREFSDFLGIPPSPLGLMESLTCGEIAEISKQLNELRAKSCAQRTYARVTRISSLESAATLTYSWQNPDCR